VLRKHLRNPAKDIIGDHYASFDLAIQYNKCFNLDLEVPSQKYKNSVKAKKIEVADRKDTGGDIRLMDK
jgi:hypothetical protein